MGDVSVIELTERDIVWPMRGTPFLPLGKRMSRRSLEIDPTPAYPHNVTLVRDMLDQVAAKWPVSWPVTIYVLPREDLGRTNGTTHVDYDYSVGGQNNHPVVARISLSAKRVQPHPAMTRYLVAHEYGHVVEDFINTALRGNSLGMSETETEYASLRGLSMKDDYGAGLWHATPCEVLANDFRILNCGIEKEFWPHPGTPDPKELLRQDLERYRSIVRWWRRQKRDCAKLLAAS